MLRVEARHHTTTRASWVMAVIHCHRPDIYYCSKGSVCPVPSAQRGMVIQASHFRPSIHNTDGHCLQSEFTENAVFSKSLLTCSGSSGHTIQGRSPDNQQDQRGMGTPCFIPLKRSLMTETGFLRFIEIKQILEILR